MHAHLDPAQIHQTCKCMIPQLSSPVFLPFSAVLVESVLGHQLTKICWSPTQRMPSSWRLGCDMTPACKYECVLSVLVSNRCVREGAFCPSMRAGAVLGNCGSVEMQQFAVAGGQAGCNLTLHLAHTFYLLTSWFGRRSISPYCLFSLSKEASINSDWFPHLPQPPT